MMTKAELIAKALNGNHVPTNNYKVVAERKAAEIGVGLYWYDLNPAGQRVPRVEVWQIISGQWSRKLGDIVRTHKGIWRT
jgi:hypothetical protein